MKNLMSLLAGRPFRAVFCSLILAGVGLAPRALAQATANPPERFNYQGYVTDATGTALGLAAPKNYDMIFRIWDAGTGGNRLWTEQQTVTVDKGNFSLLLGEGANIGESRPDLSTLFNSATASDRYVEVTVKGISAGVDATLAPRLRMVPTAYAFLAAKATTAVTAATATSVDGAGVTTGTIADARLSANIPKLASANTFTAAQTINGTLTVTTLGVTGAATVGTTLGVTGATTLTGNATVGGTLGVTGNTTVGNTTAGILSAPYAALVNIPYVVLAESFSGLSSLANKGSISGLNVRDFNVIQTDTHSLCVLNQNVTVTTGGAGSTSVTGSTFTLKAGTYRCDITAPAYQAFWHKLRLYNVTGAAGLVTGSLVYSYPGTTNVDYPDGIYPARLVGQFTLSADSVLRVDHFIQNANPANGIRAWTGNLNWSDQKSVYGVAQFWKVQ